MHHLVFKAVLLNKNQKHNTKQTTIIKTIETKYPIQILLLTHEVLIIIFKYIYIYLAHININPNHLKQSQEVSKQENKHMNI